MKLKRTGQGPRGVQGSRLKNAGLQGSKTEMSGLKVSMAFNTSGLHYPESAFCPGCKHRKASGSGIHDKEFGGSRARLHRPSKDIWEFSSAIFCVRGIFWSSLLDQSAEGGLLRIGNKKKREKILRKTANDCRKLPIILNTTRRHGAPKNPPLLRPLFYRPDQFSVVIATVVKLHHMLFLEFLEHYEDSDPGTMLVSKMDDSF